MNIETLVVMLGIALIAAVVARLISGWTFAGVLVSFLLACFGAVGGWYVQGSLGLPPLYTIAVTLGNNPVAVPVVWPTIAAVVLALFGGIVRRRPRVRRRLR